jgi:hypothetical protein
MNVANHGRGNYLPKADPDLFFILLLFDSILLHIRAQKSLIREFSSRECSMKLWIRLFAGLIAFGAVEPQASFLTCHSYDTVDAIVYEEYQLVKHNFSGKSVSLIHL